MIFTYQFTQKLNYMKRHYVIHAESHTKRCADLVLAMAITRIVPLEVTYHEGDLIKWTFKDHVECYRVLVKSDEISNEYHI